MNVNDDGEPLVMAQNLEVGKTYYKKHKRGEFIPVILAALPNPNLVPPENEHVAIKYREDGEPRKVHKGLLYEVAPLPVEEDVVMLDGGRGRKRKSRKAKKTIRSRSRRHSRR